MNVSIHWSRSSTGPFYIGRPDQYVKPLKTVYWPQSGAFFPDLWLAPPPPKPWGKIFSRTTKTNFTARNRGLPRISPFDIQFNRFMDFIALFSSVLPLCQLTPKNAVFFFVTGEIGFSDRSKITFEKKLPREYVVHHPKQIISHYSRGLGSKLF